MPRDDLHGVRVVAIPVCLLVPAVERLGNRLRITLARIDRNEELVTLAAVAHAEHESDLAVAACAKRALRGFDDQLPDDGDAALACATRAQVDERRSCHLARPDRLEQSSRRAAAGGSRDDRDGRAECPREAGAVRRASAARADDGVLARIEAAVD